MPVLNWIWLALILSSIVYAAYTGRMTDVTQGLFEGTKSAVQLVIGLVGGMMFMLGLVRIAFDGGLRDWIARRRCTPERLDVTLSQEALTQTACPKKAAKAVLIDTSCELRIREHGVGIPGEQETRHLRRRSGSTRPGGIT